MGYVHCNIVRVFGDKINVVAAKMHVCDSYVI